MRLPFSVGLSERVVRHLLVMGAVAGEAAFEEGEGIHLPRFGDQAALAVEEAGDLAGSAAFPAGEGDVRVKGAVLGLEADLLTGALDL